MGATKKLESELKDKVISSEINISIITNSFSIFIFHLIKSERIRTIIKARGLSYPNITGKTFAVFRVDSTHHLVSLVSMLSPSPDWFVGVSELELCKTDCTWVEHKVVELYPWDAGTDSGTSYNVRKFNSLIKLFVIHIQMYSQYFSHLIKKRDHKNTYVA